MIRVAKVDRYILSEIAAPFLGTCIFFFFTFFMFQTLRLAEFLIVHQVPFAVVIKIGLCLLLSFSNFVFPIAFLASTLFATGRLSVDGEWVALRSVGVSIDRMTGSFLGFGVAVSLLSLLVSLEIGPWSERTLTKMLFTAGAARATSSLKPRLFNSFFDLVVYSEDTDPRTGRLHNVFIYDERMHERPVAVVAESGEILQVQAQNEFSKRVMLKLHEGSTYQLGAGFEEYQKMDFKTYSLFLQVDVSEARDPDLPRMASLKTLIVRGATGGAFATELWKRLTLSFSPIIFAFLGVGLGTIRTRSTRTAGILLTFAAAFLYWELLVVATWLSNSNQVPAYIALHLPNLVIGSCAAFFYLKTRSQ